MNSRFLWVCSVVLFSLTCVLCDRIYIYLLQQTLLAVKSGFCLIAHLVFEMVNTATRDCFLLVFL